MSQFCCGRGDGRPNPPLANPLDDPAIRERTAVLEREIAELAQEQTVCAAEVRGLLEREAAGEGPFAQEINTLKQRKMMLATEVQHRKAKLNALLLGI